MINYERRFYCETVRAEGSLLVGYAAVFGKKSQQIRFVETIRQGAFTDTLDRGDDVRALREHNPELIIGRTPSTLVLRQDQKGLIAEITPPNTQAGRDVLELVHRGDLRHMSIGFNVIDDVWGRREDQGWREIRKADLLDVSIVAFPAYPDTEITARAIKLARRFMPDPVDYRGAWTRRQLASQLDRCII